ncbi:hypothetical protein L6452_13346 [Arctium lappa]|uniref:Uncharacterized protein n=1 Tax=Arctium lappa TaxID=4217 RepID=A0ACB9CI04_ARCLA|nr:hypothetical protein L6452_13346 [Arctium lappa]
MDVYHLDINYVYLTFVYLSSQLTLFFYVFLQISASADACKSVFVFGDSLFDPGNNHYIPNCTLQADFPPYGSSFFHHPTGRFTNGRTVADFIAQFLKIKFQRPFQEVYRELANGHLNNFPTNGINFASAGSGVLPETNKASRVTPIQVQLQQFQTLIQQNHLRKKQTKKSLFFLESGANDIFTYFLFPSPPLTQKAYVHAMLKEVVHFLDQIYKLGARSIAIFSVGPLGCIPGRVLLPGASVNECDSRVTDMVKYYNAGLERLVYIIPIRYPGAIGVYGAVDTTVENFRANGNLYGFDNVNEACCGDGPLNGMLQCGLRGYKMCSNPNKFFFFDYFHPSERTYELVSKAMWAGNKSKIRPMNLKTFAQYRTHPIDSKTLAPNNTLPSP